MCGNIRTLFNFDPPVTPEEVRAASLQFVRKISGFTKPTKANFQPEEILFPRCCLCQTSQSSMQVLARAIALGTIAITGGLSAGSSARDSSKPTATANPSMRSDGANATTAKSSATLA
jgi:hypothetical protein